MSLRAGQRLGAYEVTGALGAGGMGEVYRARDTRLGREVAIKVLPEDLARDAERLLRFEREARLLATLNHPGIAGIYGIEDSSGAPVLVLELVEGPTLDVRLRGPLPLRDALELGRQILEALEAAHEKGIVHRDLKPANVKLTAAGKVKLLDFGLAKALEGEAPAVGTQAPTVSGTASGVVLGTPAYMSPEQARGELLDKRTDVWSFGCVLYEMLSGRRAFGGGTASDAIAALLEREPDWAVLPEATPLGVRSLLRRCLQKDRAKRLRDVGDARLELEEGLAQPETLALSSSRAKVVRPRRAGSLTAGAALGLAVGLGSMWTATRPAKRLPPSVKRLALEFPASGDAAIAMSTPVAISPDGGSLAFSGRSGLLYLRGMAEHEPKAIPGTQGANNPFFSPDGRWLGFAAEGKLKKVSLQGGLPVVLCSANAVRGASWGPDRTIVFAEASSGLIRVGEDGGATEVLTRPDSKAAEGGHRWPQILPDNRGILFTVWHSSGREDDGRIAVLEAGRHAPRVVVEGGTYGRFVPGGHLVYARGNALHAAAFDLTRLLATGAGEPVLQDVLTFFSGSGLALYDFSLEGTLVFISGPRRLAARSLVWVDRSGRSEAVTEARRAYIRPRLSPEGGRVAVSIGGESGADIWRLDIAGGTWTRLTSEKDNLGPAWSPDGKRIAFSSNRAGAYNLFSISADGGPAERLASGVSWQFPMTWSADGEQLLFVDSGHNADIRRLLLSKRAVEGVLESSFNELSPSLSPDGRYMAFQTDESGQREIRVRTYPALEGNWPASSGGGTEPVWSPDGTELFYFKGDQMMSVAVRLAPKLELGAPRPLFRRQFYRGFHPPTYDVSRDGRRFLMVLDDLAEPASPSLVVVPNWFEELRGRVKTAR